MTHLEPLKWDIIYVACCNWDLQTRIRLMLQSHHTLGPRMGCSRAVLNKIVRPLTGPVRAPCGDIRILSPRTGSFNTWIISLRAQYGLRDRKQSLNSPCRDRTGPIQPNTTPVWECCKFWLCQFSYLSVRVPYGTLVGPARAAYGSRRIWKTLDIAARGPYDARVGIARSPCGVLSFIFYQTISVQPCQAVRDP